MTGTNKPSILKRPLTGLYVSKLVGKLNTPTPHRFWHGWRAVTTIPGEVSKLIDVQISDTYI
jgi:hypothetical protein